MIKTDKELINALYEISNNIKTLTEEIKGVREELKETNKKLNTLERGQKEMNISFDDMIKEFEYIKCIGFDK